MEKKNFIALVLGTIGGLLFSLGMCMVLLPEWEMLEEGKILGTVGGVVLLITYLVYRKMSGKKAMEFLLHWCLEQECVWLWYLKE